MDASIHTRPDSRKLIKRDMTIAYARKGGQRKSASGGSSEIQKRLRWIPEAFCRFKPGDFLLSHTVARAVPSGLRSLTTVFGMGTGGSSSLKSPRSRVTTEDMTGTRTREKK